MSQLLINLSPDLKRLQDEGYELAIQNGYALVSNVPYVNAQKEIKFGTLVSNLTLNGNITQKPSDHVMQFIGEQPCNAEGTTIQQIVHTSGNRSLASNIIINRSFSNKPTGGYDDYHHKFTQYISILQNPAQALLPTATATTFKPIEAVYEDEIFKYIDTNSGRAGITGVYSKFENQRIAIIGLGGTGSYILDFAAKTPIKEIHLFDGDEYCQHNAFRSPGSTSIDDLRDCKFKVEYHKDRYAKMRNGIHAHTCYLDEQNLNLLDGFDFVLSVLIVGQLKKVSLNF